MTRVHTTLVLVRHGESVWNRAWRLTGWEDVPLNDRGRAQARNAGERLRARGFRPSVAWSSELRRATETRDLLLDALDVAPERRTSWRLNERHYGALQGLRAWQAVWRFGLPAVSACKRELDVRPPLVPLPTLPLTAGISDTDADAWRQAQRGESLADALARFLPVWEDEIAPDLHAGKAVLVVGHNNVLRALLHHLAADGGRPPARLVTGQPWILQLNENLRVVEHSLA